MTPSATEVAIPVVENIKEKVLNGEQVTSLPDPTKDNGYAVGDTPGETQPKLETGHKEPLKLSGALDHFQQFDVTPIIGREFVDVDLAAWIRAPNSDELIRDLAITISQRGVVFFRMQDNITNDLQKELVQRLGELSGKPATSNLHIHPVINSEREDGGGDNEISVISSEGAKKIQLHRYLSIVKSQSQRKQWHSDIIFEPVPSDYSLLRMTQLPKTGGDTLWASGYELYDRISKPLRSFLDTLTAFCARPSFTEPTEKSTYTVFKGARGAPENIGETLEAVHPVIRTNPVTGWKSVYAIGHHTKLIHGLHEPESQHFLQWFMQLICENHDLQLRHRWEHVNDMAIWDNRGTYHAATPDYMFSDLGERAGSRAVSVGEKPYFDPQSKSWREALADEH